MAFPQTPLPISVEISLDGSTWTDITTDVRSDSQIQITRGRSDWGQQVDAGRCSFSLENTTGKYSPRNPEGTYYGQIGRNTPVRVSVETGSVAAWLPGTATGVDTITTPDAAALDVTGDIDVRLDATLMNWYLADTSLGTGSTSILTELIGKFNTSGNQRSWTMYTQSGYLKFSWSEDGTSGNGYVATSTAKLPVPASGRMAVRVALDVNNGSGGWTCRFYTAENIDATWQQLGSDVTFGATTSIYASTATLHIGNAITGVGYNTLLGYVHAAEVRNGIGGSLVADPDFTAQTSGASSFVDSAGRTWSTNGLAEITNRKVRFVGEIASWTPEWDTGGFDVVTRVEAAGIMRRLGQGAVAAKSPMYREFVSPSRTNIVAYWPMEDGENATELASGLDDHPPLRITGTVTPAAYSSWAASDPVPTITTGSLNANIPAYTATNYLFLRVFLAVPAAGVASTQRLFSFTTTGTARVWSLYLNTAGSLDLRAYDEDGTQIASTGFFAFAVNGEQKSIGVELTQSGSDIDYTVFSYDIRDSTLSSSSASTTGGTLTTDTFGIATQIRFGEDGLLNGTAFGHLAISDDVNGFSSTAGALLGWNGETAGARVHRLGIEEGFTAYSVAPGDEQMGSQPRSTVLDLMRNAGDVDEGILAEQRDVLGIRLVQRNSMYSQPVLFTMNYTGDDGLVAPLDPADDDQSVTNDVTVAREGGSSSRATLSTGALSTQAPPDGIGLYDTSYTLHLFSDTQPPLHAGWKLHLGTWDETRFPTVNVNLAGAPASINSAAAMDIGCRLQITNPEVWLPPDTLDLMVQGYSETLSQYTWNIAFNCTPAAPWSVAYAGDDGDSQAFVESEFTWADTEGSALAEALTTTETDVDLHTTSGPYWTGNVSDMPFDLRVGGEVMTVTAPGTLQVSNPFFDTNITGWSGSSTTVARSTAVVNPHPRALASMLVTPAGGVAAVSARSDLTAVGSIVPGQRYRVSSWVYSPGGWTGLYPAAQWADSAGTVLSSSGTSATVAAGVWTYLESTVTAPASTSRVRMTVRADNTPAASDTYYVWGPRITRLNSSFLYDEFGRTAASSWASADTGQAWQTGGGTAADYNVTGGYGSHRLATTAASRRSFIDFTYTDFDIYASLTTSATATGGSLFGGPTGRHVDSSNLYQARLSFSTANVVALDLIKIVAGVETTLGSYTLFDFSGSTAYAAGTYVKVRFQGTGTTLRAKAWSATNTEPGSWNVSVTDTSITTSSFIGLRSISASANTNVNPEIRYDSVEVADPQTVTVTRSQNGVVKTHSSGADVRLANPAYTAL